MTDQLREAAKAAAEWLQRCPTRHYSDRLHAAKLATNLRAALEVEQKSGHSPPKPNDAWDEEDRPRTDEDWFFEAGHGED